AGQAHRRLHDDVADEITDSSTADRLDALAAQPELAAALRFGRHVQRRRAVQGRHFDLGAEGGLCKSQRHLAMQVVAIALEDVMLANFNFDIQIARFGTGRTRLALAAEADAIAGIDTGGNLDLQRAFVVDAALAPAGSTRIADGLAG